MSRRALPALAALLAAGAAQAAPLPRLGPLDVCGPIVSRDWVAGRRAKALRFASGSLSADRVFPPHHRVVIRPDGLPRALAEADARIANWHAGHAGRPGEIALLLPAPRAALPAAARAICVRGYEAWGDEGGSWTKLRAIEPR